MKKILKEIRKINRDTKVHSLRRSVKGLLNQDIINEYFKKEK